LFKHLKAVRFPGEMGVLLALAFFLPLFEAPKNLLWLAYVAVWVVNRLRAQDLGSRWDGWDTLFALWIASAFAAAAFAGMHHDEWRSTSDVVRYVSILWLVKRSGYSDRELKAVLGMLVASTVIGLAYGYWRLYSGEGKSGTLQLHSVGHVNHTAIYIAIMLGVCAAWLFAAWPRWRLGQRAVGLAVAVLVLVSLIVTASRGAVGIGLVLLGLLALAWWPRWRAPLAGVALILVLVTVAAAVIGLDVVRKQEQNEANSNVLSFRDGVWRMGLEGWRRYPVFGVGLDNYQYITPEAIKGWRSERGEDFDPARYVHFPHGHSLFVNTLAERGVAGLAALGAVLFAWLAALVRLRPRRGDDDLAWLLWGGALSGWFVSVGVGTVNTTLHHEHAILATLLLGLWLARTARPRAS
jgi:O-antigen ligase